MAAFPFRLAAARGARLRPDTGACADGHGHRRTVIAAQGYPAPGSAPDLRTHLATCRTLASAFRRVVFAQFWISAINTLLTGLYLGVVLPAFGVHLPLVKTLVAITFIVGLLPDHRQPDLEHRDHRRQPEPGPAVVLTSTVYLIVIHKLEYFSTRASSARTSMRAPGTADRDAGHGSRLRPRRGLVAAPIFYAYFKD